MARTAVAAQATCLDGGKRHSWWKAGLDIHRGACVSVRVCVWCEAIQRRKPKPHPRRDYL